MADMTFKANLLPVSDLKKNLGSSTQKWNIYGNILSTQPQLAGATESNEITIKDLGNNNPLSTPSQRHGIDFKWYNSHWIIGNLRSTSTPSAGFGFSFSEDGTTYTNKVIIGNDGYITASGLHGNANTADKWKTARTLTIGATGKSVDGSANISWSKTEIIGSGNTGQFLRGDHSWTNILANEYITTSANGLRLVGGSGTTKSMLFRNDGTNFYILCCNATGAGSNWYTPTGGGHPFRINLETGYVYTTRTYGAVWNDYAEMRNVDSSIEPGRCVREVSNGEMVLSTERLERGCKVISDTYGFNIGETEKCKTPIAVSGRVLVYLYEGREYAKSHVGWPVCSGPDGTVSVMSEEEEIRYPSRIIGTISEIPEYETWGTGSVQVNDRIWIYVR